MKDPAWYMKIPCATTKTPLAKLIGIKKKFFILMLEPGKHMLLYTCKSIWLASNFQYRYYMILLFN